ncbi:MAG: DoxX family protein [Acidobacteriota bacterium]|nr:DoxX family protein [Acidobacteriota bacterium]
MTFEELGRNLPALFSAMLVAILFIQSGLDKVFDWRGNVEWLTGHFSKTFLGGMVPLLLATITVMELATGFLSAAGIVYFLATGSTALIFYASALGAASIVALFFGQRVAKDYPGAAVLVPYFILLIILMYLTNPFLKL